MSHHSNPKHSIQLSWPAFVLFLLLAAAIGAAGGYFAYWARQQAVAEHRGPDAGAPVAALEGAGPGEERLDPGVPPGPGTGTPDEAPPDGDAPEAAPPDGGAPDGDGPGDAVPPPPGGTADPRAADGAPPRPRIAIVIDDWGYDWAAAEAFLQFPEKLTVAVIPFLPLSEEHAQRARAAGHEVIVHLPMEPLNPDIELGPGGVYVAMDDEAIAEAVGAALAAVPGNVGMNNHMGSRATMEPRVMRAVLGVLREEQKFFVDSFTTAATVGPAVAREMAVPYAVNQVFLDHEDDEEAIRAQLRRLADLARQRGAAVGIGHVRPRTYRALVEMLPELQAQGFEFVTVSEILNMPAPEAAAAPAGTPAAVPAPADSAPAASAAPAEAAASGPVRVGP